MFFTRIGIGMQKSAGLAAKAEWDRFHSAKAFRLMLDRARACADRNGDEFSLVVFSTEHLEPDDATLIHLVRALRRHLRLSDEVGSLDRYRVGVVLPGTTAEGAWALADRVCLCYPPDVPLPQCEVRHYPTDWQGDEPAGLDAVEQPPTETRPVHAMEPLFMQQMPTWKRCLDVAGATTGLISLAPLFALAALSTKVSSPGPIFFRQWRSGLGGKEFQLVKFRSMVVDAESKKQDLMGQNEQDGPAFKIKADPRVTPLGRFLRATSIDELPQLWNVLTGDMSLVGPRPLPCHESVECHGWQQRRLDVTPGLTCIWQIKGRSKVSFAEWMRMDIQYIRSRSLWLDLKLVFQTAPAMLFGRGS